MFQPDGFGQTYAEMEAAVKNGISHRYKALCALRDFLIGQQEEGEGSRERRKEEKEVPQTKRLTLDN